MSQLAYSSAPFTTPGHFGPSPAGAAPAAYLHHLQGYHPHGADQQAFAQPGVQQQSRHAPYHDGVSGGIFQQTASSTGASMMQPPSAGLQQQQAQPQNPYLFAASSSGTASSVPAQAPTPPIPQHRQSASPQQRLSPNAGNQLPPRPNTHTPPTKFPMAAPPLPQTPANQQQAGSSANNAPAIASPKTPQSPGAQSRDQQRVALLLEINISLFAEVKRLQEENKGGALSPQQAAQARANGQPAHMASEEYIQCLRRVQANLAYLMPRAQSSASNTEAKVPPGPAHMTPPPSMPQLQEKYEQLRELFPSWQGLDQRAASAGNASSPRPNMSAQGGMNGRLSNAQPNANGVPAAGSPS